MKKLLIVIGMLLSVVCYSQITITVTLTGTPNDTTKLIPANLKYNKLGRVGITVDDQQKSTLNLAAIMSGGTAIENGVTYPGKTFTDGANVRGKNIPYTASVAANAYAADTNQSNWGLTSGHLTKADMQYLISKNWDLLDHGAWHGLDGTGPASLGGINTFQNAALNRNAQFRNFGYVMRVGVVPTADTGYHWSWEQLGYLGGSSQGVHDGYPGIKPGWDQHGIVNVTNWKNENRYKVHLRTFHDFQAMPYGSAWDFLDGAILMCNQLTNGTALSFEHGMHNAYVDTTIKAIDSLYKSANDRVWVCGMQEFLEYFYVIQQTGVKQTLSGNTLTVVLDQSFLADETRYRDMSFLLSSNSSISSVTVTGADDWSYNTSTGLINIYKKKTTGFQTPPYYDATGFVFNQKINLQRDDIFFDNNAGEYYDDALGQMIDYTTLIDGNTSVRYYARRGGQSMIYSPYELTFDLGDYGAVVKKVRIYAAGSGFTTQVVLRRNDNNADSIIGTYTGGSGWIEFTTPTYKYVASQLILRSDNSGGFGTEVEVYADHHPYTEQTYPHRKSPLGQMLGVNSYPWDFIEVASSELNPGKAAAFNSLGLRSLRNYDNVDFYQQANGAKYSFNPIRTGHGEDIAMQQLKLANPKLIRWSVMQGQSTAIRQTWRDNPNTNAVINGTVTSYQDFGSYGLLTVNVTSTVGAGQGPWFWRIDNLTRPGVTSYQEGAPVTIPTSLPATVQYYVDGGFSSNYQVGDNVSAKEIYTSLLNIPYSYNSIAGRASLEAYDSSAHLAYVYTARKGRNPNASPFVPETFTDGSIGINSSEWMEAFGNEPNGWWFGYNGYLNGRSLAYAWSRDYDNNKTYSTFYGAKNADTSMKVSTSGLAINTVDLNRGADQTTRYLRGNRPKSNVPMQPMDWRSRTFGWVDNPYDIVQFHSYAYTGGADQYGSGVNSGLPFELAPNYQGIKDFVWFRDKYAPWALVDVGEWGYDLHYDSPMNVVPIGSKNIDQVRAAWAIRTMLCFNILGVDYSQWYRLYSTDSVSVQFSTMSLLRQNENGTFTRRLVGDYFAQLSEFGDYTFDSTLREDSIRVYRWKKDTSYLYAIWSVENYTNYTNSFLLKTEKATFTERTGAYNLPLQNGKNIHVRNFIEGNTVMSNQDATVAGSSYAVSYSLTPTFIQVGGVVSELPQRFEFKVPKGKKIILKQ